MSKKHPVAVISEKIKSGKRRAVKMVSRPEPIKKLSDRVSSSISKHQEYALNLSERQREQLANMF